MCTPFVSSKQKTINGCTVEDYLTLQARVNENVDLLNINQNAGGDPSDELIQFYNEKFCVFYIIHCQVWIYIYIYIIIYIV